MLILLLESDRLLAKNIRAALERAGHRVVHIVEPQTAIAVSDSKTPELVIMELQLAGRSGVEFLFEFRSYPEWAAVPVIIMSNLPQTDAKAYLDSMAKLDVKNYFYKPATSLTQLVEAVGQLIPVVE